MQPVKALKQGVKNGTMPIIARFYGIIIKMFFNEHLPPHFHALYGEYNAIFNINTLEMIEGDMPLRARKLVMEWAENHQKELEIMWETKEFKQLPGLE
ncbi:hypothetical protein MTBGP_06760 [Moorella thermoacetica]